MWFFPRGHSASGCIRGYVVFIFMLTDGGIDLVLDRSIVTLRWQTEVGSEGVSFILHY